MASVPGGHAGCARRSPRATLRSTTGSELSARVMVQYFEPLRRCLVEQNKDHTCTLPELWVAGFASRG
jgi:hypothetical protein